MNPASQQRAAAQRILVVDDDAALRKLIARHLRRSGFAVVEAADAAQALVEAQKQDEPFDLVLTDVHLPGISGIELARLLLTRSPMHPVVVITGDRDESLAWEALSHGATGYLLKPFELSELDAMVEQALGRLALVKATGALTQGAGATAERVGDGHLPAAWVRLADERSGAGAGHGYRVAHIAEAIVVALPEAPSPEEHRVIEQAARAHELGRLLGPSTDPAELATRTANFLAELGVDREVVRAVRHMHEHWGGTGGPDRLSGRDIPLTSLILSAADAVDHYAATRAARGVKPDDAAAGAVDLVMAKAGTIFSPTVANAIAETRSIIEALWTLARLPGLEAVTA